MTESICILLLLLLLQTPPRFFFHTIKMSICSCCQALSQNLDFGVPSWFRSVSSAPALVVTVHDSDQKEMSSNPNRTRGHDVVPQPCTVNAYLQVWISIPPSVVGCGICWVSEFWILIGQMALMNFL